jgi:hypothetical protein
LNDAARPPILAGGLMRALKRRIRRAWSNGVIMGVLILIVAVLIAWGNAVRR